MQPEEIKAEIAALEIQLRHYQFLLDKSFEANDEFKKTKVIYHKMKRVADRLEELKNQTSSSNE